MATSSDIDFRFAMAEEPWSIEEVVRPYVEVKSDSTLISHPVDGHECHGRHVRTPIANQGQAGEEASRVRDCMEADNDYNSSNTSEGEGQLEALSASQSVLPIQPWECSSPILGNMFFVPSHTWPIFSADVEGRGINGNMLGGERRPPLITAQNMFSESGFTQGSSSIWPAFSAPVEGRELWRNVLAIASAPLTTTPNLFPTAGPMITSSGESIPQLGSGQGSPIASICPTLPGHAIGRDFTGNMMASPGASALVTATQNTPSEVERGSSFGLRVYSTPLDFEGGKTTDRVFAAPRSNAPLSSTQNISSELEGRPSTYPVWPAISTHRASSGSTLIGSIFPQSRPRRNFGNMILPEATPQIDTGEMLQSGRLLPPSSGSSSSWMARLLGLNFPSTHEMLQEGDSGGVHGVRQASQDSLSTDSPYHHPTRRESRTGEVSTLGNQSEHSQLVTEGNGDHNNVVGRIALPPPQLQMESRMGERFGMHLQSRSGDLGGRIPPEIVVPTSSPNVFHEDFGTLVPSSVPDVIRPRRDVHANPYLEQAEYEGKENQRWRGHHARGSRPQNLDQISEVGSRVVSPIANQLPSRQLHAHIQTTGQELPSISPTSRVAIRLSTAPIVTKSDVPVHDRLSETSVALEPYVPTELLRTYIQDQQPEMQAGSCLERDLDKDSEERRERSEARENDEKSQVRDTSYLPNVNRKNKVVQEYSRQSQVRDTSSLNVQKTNRELAEDGEKSQIRDSETSSLINVAREKRALEEDRAEVSGKCPRSPQAYGTNSPNEENQASQIPSRLARPRDTGSFDGGVQGPDPQTEASGTCSRWGTGEKRVRQSQLQGVQSPGKSSKRRGQNIGPQHEGDQESDACAQLHPHPPQTKNKVHGQGEGRRRRVTTTSSISSDKEHKSGG